MKLCKLIKKKLIKILFLFLQAINANQLTSFYCFFFFYFNRRKINKSLSNILILKILKLILKKSVDTTFSMIKKIYNFCLLVSLKSFI